MKNDIWGGCAYTVSLITLDHCNLESQIHILESGGIDLLHVDILDGHFSPSMPLGLETVRQLRQTYPKSSYNCMIQSQDTLIALNAAGRERTSSRIVEIYEEYGEGEKALDYRVMRYRPLADDQNNAAGIVVASSGFDQFEADGWKDLGNDQMIVASNRTGQWSIRSI